MQFIVEFCVLLALRRTQNALHCVACTETSRPAAKRRKKKPASGAGSAASIQSGSPTAARQKKSPGPVMFGSVVEVGLYCCFKKAKDAIVLL